MINEELKEKERIIAQLEKRILELEDATIINKTNFRINELEQRIKEIEKFVKMYRSVTDDVYEQNILVEKNLERNNAKFDKLNELVMTKVKTTEDTETNLKLLQSRYKNFSEREEKHPSIVQTFRGDFKIVAEFKNISLALGQKDSNISYLIALSDFTNKYRSLIN